MVVRSDYDPFIRSLYTPVYTRLLFVVSFQGIGYYGSPQIQFHYNSKQYLTLCLYSSETTGFYWVGK